MFGDDSVDFLTTSSELITLRVPTDTERAQLEVRSYEALLVFNMEGMDAGQNLASFPFLVTFTSQQINPYFEGYADSTSLPEWIVDLVDSTGQETWRSSAYNLGLPPIAPSQIQDETSVRISLLPQELEECSCIELIEASKAITFQVYEDFYRNVLSSTMSLMLKIELSYQEQVTEYS